MRYCYLLLVALIISCKPDPQQVYYPPVETVPYPVDTAALAVHQDSVFAGRIVRFAKTLIGTRYSFGCMAPATGFDCSGFISYIFNHFNIEVPRSSVEFTNEGTTVALKDAREGDLILFTGTNSKIRIVGHIGMIVSNDASGITFIHSSSGKENSVIVTTLNASHMTRFVKVIRII
jgi:cell wall-associated NlpC family hydrolase